MIHRILLAYDGSETARRAYAVAVDLAGKYQAELHVLTVARPPEFGDEVETEAVIEHSRRYHERLLHALKRRAAEQGVSARFEVAVGHPAEQIIYHAEQHGADLIVMGHRGEGRVRRWLLGSVSKQVLSHAHCAVLVVR